MEERIEVNLNLTTVGTELVETINKIKVGLTEQFQAISSNLRQNREEIVHEVETFIRDLTQALQEGNWEKIFTSFEQGEELLARMKAYIGQIKESIGGYAALDLEKILPEERLNEVKKRITAFSEFFTTIRKSFTARDWEEVARYLLPEKVFSSVLQVQTGVEKAREWVNGIKQAFMAEGLEAVIKKVLPEELVNKIFTGKEIYQKIKEYLNGIKQAFLDGGIGEVLRKIISQDFQENFGQTLGNLQEWLQQIPANFSAAFQNISSKLGDFITGIVGNIQVVWDFITGLPALFTHSVQAIGSVLGNIFNSLVKMMSNVWQYIVNIIKNIGTWLSGIPGREEGGGVTANKPYIVGEKGPELFIPGSNGYILPNHQLSGQRATLAAAPQVTVNIINNTGQPVTTREESHFDGQQYVVSVWLDALSRNVGGLRDVVMAGR